MKIEERITQREYNQLMKLRRELMNDKQGKTQKSIKRQSNPEAKDDSQPKGSERRRAGKESQSIKASPEGRENSEREIK